MVLMVSVVETVSGNDRGGFADLNVIVTVSGRSVNIIYTISYQRSAQRSKDISPAAGEELSTLRSGGGGKFA